jgi:hypothetical protein
MQHSIASPLKRRHTIFCVRWKLNLYIPYEIYLLPSLSLGSDVPRETTIAVARVTIKPLKPELNPSAQCCLPRILLGILIFKELNARRLCKSFGVKGLSSRSDLLGA